MTRDFSRRLEDAIELLEAIREDRALLANVDGEDRKRLLTAAGQVARPGPWAKRELAKAARRKRRNRLRQGDEAILARTRIRQKRSEPIYPTPELPPMLPGGAPTEHRPIGSVEEARNCYVCKRDFHEIHFFYDQMCPPCAAFNYAKRSQSADLTGRVALITGARVKIGYQAAIMLLRAGARVIVTTRFPRDAAARYAREADFSSWRDRLQVHGLDLRHTPSVEAFARHLCDREDRLDFIINNACQTVRRPVGFYSHLMEGERTRIAELPPDQRRLLGAFAELSQGDDSRTESLPEEITSQRRVLDSAALSQLALLDEDLEQGTHLFPAGQLDADLQQVDLRGRNSWRLALDEVSAVELLEVQLVNAVAPFILNARLRKLMRMVPTQDKHIVNVSAMEGQFYRSYKTDKHPHTNMAKAALNMMTRTSAMDYIQDGIHMNSVDTGWVTDEDPAAIADRKREEHRFHPPLDIVDGAARICDPIFSGLLTGEHVWGQFLKDYRPTAW